MKNNILLQVLEKFTIKELNQLNLFVQASYFNTSNKLIRTLTYLTNCLKKGVSPNKIELYQYVFDEKKPFNDHKIRLLLSDLLKLVESFIVQENDQSEKVVPQIKLATFYRENGLEKHFNRVQRKALNQLEVRPYRNYEYFSAKNQLEWEQYKMSSSQKRDIDINLQDLGQNFDIAYFSAKLRQACFLKAQQAFYAIEYDFNWVQQILRYIEKKGWQHIPAIALYYTAYQLTNQQEGDVIFKKLKQQILDYGTLFPSKEIRHIYLLAINFCIKKVNNGQRVYAQESLKLYKKGLEIGCFLEKGFLSKFTYANVVAFGLMTEDFSWTEAFIQEYKNKLQKKSRNSAFAFNMARLMYVQNKDYEAALDYLQKVSDKDLLNTLNAKILKLRIYWEIKEWNLLDSHLEAMANFIRRREIIGYHKANFLNIIKFTKRLLKVNFYDQKAMEKLRTIIELEEIVSEKKWLLAQLDLLKQT